MAVLFYTTDIVILVDVGMMSQTRIFQKEMKYICIVLSVVEKKETIPVEETS